MIRTRFTERFGLEHPVMSAPMAMHSGGTLAGAVTAAGGLGSFGGIAPGKGPAWVRDEIATIRSVTDGPFAVGFITAFLEYAQPLLDAVLEGGPAAVALSFGDPAPWIGRIHDADALAIVQVQTIAAADNAVAAGADLLVVQGNEAGGHTGTMGLFPFLPLVSARHPGMPLLAAGGIADGRTLAAALLAGADGAWLGTAFLATPEAIEVSDVHKRLVLESDGSDTVFTRSFDILSGLPWPEGIGERVRRNRTTDQWAGRDEELLARRAEVVAERSDRVAAVPGSFDPDVDEVIYGSSAGLVSSIQPAGEVVRSISEAAEVVLRDRSRQLLSDQRA